MKCTLAINFETATKDDAINFAKWLTAKVLGEVITHKGQLPKYMSKDLQLLLAQSFEHLTFGTVDIVGFGLHTPKEEGDDPSSDYKG